MVEILLTIGAVSSALMGIGALIVALSKKPKKWIREWAAKITREEVDTRLQPLMEKIDFVVKKAEELDEAEKTRLGHSIMTIYDRSMSRGFITKADRKDLVELHQRYKDKGGNHHVDEYYDILMDMDSK